eukprot:TRINITY_DN15071_c0_g1_i1.p1 TRINITY_DN15071_c0_g1~~TRINITY_DN15071_c0_g1_i1.p1  ORF type:complete len:100 (-),score=12.60 TRINITY_DN15071_c0_g1_i1:240-539(-)
MCIRDSAYEAVFGTLLHWIGDHPYAAALLRRKEAVGPSTVRICLKCDCHHNDIGHIANLCEHQEHFKMYTTASHNEALAQLSLASILESNSQRHCQSSK